MIGAALAAALWMGPSMLTVCDEREQAMDIVETHQKYGLIAGAMKYYEYEGQEGRWGPVCGLVEGRFKIREVVWQGMLDWGDRDVLVTVARVRMEGASKEFWAILKGVREVSHAK